MQHKVVLLFSCDRFLLHEQLNVHLTYASFQASLSKIKVFAYDNKLWIHYFKYENSVRKKRTTLMKK